MNPIAKLLLLLVFLTSLLRHVTSAHTYMSVTAPASHMAYLQGDSGHDISLLVMSEDNSRHVVKEELSGCVHGLP